MKIVFDQGVPVPLRHHLYDHTVDTVYELGWSTLDNGDLLDEAEGAGYEVLITTDKNIRHQQNLSGRRLAIAVLPSPRWPALQSRISELSDALSKMGPGELLELP